MNKRMTALGLALLLALTMSFGVMAEETVIGEIWRAEPCTLHFLSCTLKEDEVSLLVSAKSFTDDFAFDDEQTACAKVLEQLQQGSADADVYFVSTADPDYQVLLASGECALLDGTTLLELVQAMPSDLTAPCFYEGSLYTAPVGFLPPAEGAEPDAARTLVVALVNPHSRYQGTAACTLDMYMNHLPKNVRSLLWPAE